MRENVEIFSLDKRVEGETTDQDGEHGKREWKLRAGTESAAFCGWDRLAGEEPGL